MSASKVLIILIVGTFTLLGINAGSISVRQLGYRHSLFEITYEYNGQKSTKSSGDIALNEGKTIEIPDGAANIHLTVYNKGSTGLMEVIFTNFYPSSVRKCFTVGTDRQLQSIWFEEPCQKLSAAGLYSISINQTQDYPVFFDLTYEYNGSNLTETSGFFSKGDKVALIPDGVTNINFNLYADSMKKYIRLTPVIEKFYRLPVEKYFEIYGISYEPRWLEKPRKKLPATNGNFLSVYQTGSSTILLKVAYEYDGSNLTEYFGGISNEENRTIQIPDKAININVTIYKEVEDGPTKWITRNVKMVFTTLFPSPVKKCFQVYSDNYIIDESVFEKSCQQLPAEIGYLITVNQMGHYFAVFEINYHYDGLNLTESSGLFYRGKSKTILIPDKATNIKLTLYEYLLFAYRRDIIVSQVYPSPVKKCFQIDNDGFRATYSEKSC